MEFLRSVIQKIKGKFSVPASETTPKAATVPTYPQNLGVSQVPKSPVFQPVDTMPETLEDAIAYVRMGEPSLTSEMIIWHDTCGKLRSKYKDHALKSLQDLLSKITTESLTETEDAIDKSLVDLQSVAPVDWTLVRTNRKDHRDGSRSYRLTGHIAIVNANGAFAITDLKGEIWFEQTSASGKPFVGPP